MIDKELLLARSRFSNCGGLRFEKRAIAPLFKILILCFLFLCTGPGIAQKTNQYWSGTWETRWRTGGAYLLLNQVGNKVTGSYPTLNETIEGEIRDGVLTGTYKDPDRSGEFSFSLSPDGSTFMGRYGTGDWWTGIRVSTATDEMVADASSPEQLFFSFLQAGNSNPDGGPERFATVIPHLDLRDYETTVSPAQRLALAEKLFNIFDQLTFRVQEVTAPPDGETTMSTTLRQAGRRGLPVELSSVRKTPRPIEWKFVLPKPEDLDTSLSVLLEPRKGELPYPQEHHQLASPRDTMRTFLEQYRVAQSGDPTLFLKTMDLSRVPQAARTEDGLLRGQYLKEVIDRIGYVLWQEIPNNSDRRGPYDHFVHPDGRIQIVPVLGEDGRRIWKFSADTLDAARELYIALEDLPVDDGVEVGSSSSFFQLRSAVRQYDRSLLEENLGMERWQWLLLAASFVTAVALSWILCALLNLAVRFWKLTTIDREYRMEILWPLRLLVLALLGLVSLRILGLPRIYDTPVRLAYGILISLSAGWLTYHLIDRVSALYDRKTARFAYRDEVLQSLISSVLKVLVLLGAGLLLAELLSIPYQGVLAGLGIGGLAFALAARSTLENLIGGITLYADKPIRVGDFCRFGDKIGTVETIGLRSVRIRALDRILVTIPNAEFVNLYIENFTRRDRILLKTILTLRYETTPDQLRWVLMRLRELLISHPRVATEGSRARFVEFGSHSLDIELFAFLETTDYGEFLAIQEDIYLRIIDIVEESGTGFAFPSVVNYLARDSGTDDTRRQNAEGIIAELRNRSELPFPEVSPEKVRMTTNSLDYPPKGSISRS